MPTATHTSRLPAVDSTAMTSSATTYGTFRDTTTSAGAAGAGVVRVARRRAASPPMMRRLHHLEHSEGEEGGMRERVRERGWQTGKKIERVRRGGGGTESGREG